MSIFHAILLGTLQGITEFLPISSSGHLVLVESILDLPIAAADMQALNVLLHAGTLVALLIAYAPVWWKLMKSPFVGDKTGVRQLSLLVVATIPGALAGLLLEDWIANHFQSLMCVSVAFAVTGVVLILGELATSKKKSWLDKVLHPLRKKNQVTVKSAFAIGITQALALVPGVSRSGFTVSAGRALGMTRKDALDFSFLMAVPIIGGATALSVFDIARGAPMPLSIQVTAVAVAVSFISSSVAIMFLRSFVARRGLSWFAPYLFVVAIITGLLHMSA